MSAKIPHLLETYVALPLEASLVLLTSVLGASSNWLVLRFMYSALKNQDGSADIASSEDPKVLLVSFMRDLAFWRENARRLGLDLDRLAAKRKFGFVDGLSGLFLPKQKLVPEAGEKILSSSNLGSISEELRQAVQILQDGGGKVVLIIDQLDLLMAAGGDSITGVDVAEMVLGLREIVHSTIITFSADDPLVSAHQTPLEVNHAALLLDTAHQADFIIALRLLDSGTARDVSGVLRITVGDQATEDKKDLQVRVEEKELLYFVGGDGGVKVFERGQ